jgi:hypothetical protein
LVGIVPCLEQELKELFLQTACERENTLVSVMTLEGRIVIPYQGYNKHLELIKKGADIAGARIWYCKSSKIYYLLIGLEVG